MKKYINIALLIIFSPLFIISCSDEGDEKENDLIIGVWAFSPLNNFDECTLESRFSYFENGTFNIVNYGGGAINMCAIAGENDGTWERTNSNEYTFTIQAEAGTELEAVISVFEVRFPDSNTMTFEFIRDNQNGNIEGLAFYDRIE